MNLHMFSLILLCTLHTKWYNVLLLHFIEDARYVLTQTNWFQIIGNKYLFLQLIINVSITLTS